MNNYINGRHGGVIVICNSNSKDYIIQCNSNSNRQSENQCNSNRLRVYCNSNCNRNSSITTHERG